MNIASTKTARSGPTSAKTADLTVVGGAGHVGIPLALAFAEAGLTVNVNDRNEAALATLKSGKLPFIEHDAEPLLLKALAGNRLVFTSSPGEIGRTGPVIITIGTPVDEFLNPVPSEVQRCIDGLLPHVADEQLLILRSTVYPGTTDWLHDYLKRLGRKNQCCLLSRARGSGLRRQGIAGNAADHQRHDGRGRTGSKRVCFRKSRPNSSMLSRSRPSSRSSSTMPTVTSSLQPPINFT